MDNRYIKEQNRNRQMQQRLKQRNGMGSTGGSQPQQGQSGNGGGRQHGPQMGMGYNPQQGQSGQYSSGQGGAGTPNAQPVSNSGSNPYAKPTGMPSSGGGNPWQNSGNQVPPSGQFPDAGNNGTGWRSGYNSSEEGGNGNGGRMLDEKFSKGIMSGFRPGNLGDINSAIWPFWFQFSSGDILPGQSLVRSFSVTQEAGFLVRQISHSTFLNVDGLYQYIDPFYFDEGVNSPNGLVFSLEDASSSRNFNGVTQRDISSLGNANFPWIYPSTLFMLPNQTMLINLSNTNTDLTFNTFVTVMGYRVRVADAARILSTVTG